MIEVEKKFILSENDEARLTEGAEFVSERVFTDVYYDTAEFTLTLKDIWLRTREEKYELKVPVRLNEEKRADQLHDQYHELENEEEIREALDLSPGKKLTDTLAEAGYSPFCTCTSTRRKYKKEGFIIDLDSVDYREDFSYQIGEIELMVRDVPEIQKAIGSIMEFATKHGLRIAPVRGKVSEYLKRSKPTHYQALVQAGVVKDY